MDRLYDKGFHHCAAIVAHPDDETLWAGGTILLDPRVGWTVITLCRGDDDDRAPRFHRALELLSANGVMGRLDDGPTQEPLEPADVRQTVLSLLSERRFDLVLTHGPQGEYTRHRRHEETYRAVSELLARGNLTASQLWTFAYEDGGGSYLPRPVRSANVMVDLDEHIWRRKYDIITGVYGFAPDSFEALATPRREAFRCIERGTQSEAAS